MNAAVESEKRTPSISVALCTHDGERFLREQMDSVLRQTGVDIEVIAFDDASRDGTPGLLREYAARDPRVRCVLNPDNLGPTRSFEYAMALCRADLIAPCDQDDVWHPAKLQRLFAALGEADLIYCDSKYIDERGIPRHGYVSDRRDMLSGREPLRFVFANSVSGHASLLRRELFDAARPFPDDLYHDWWLAICAAAHRGVAYLDQALVQFRRHGGVFSTMGRMAGDSPGQGDRTWLELCLRRLRLITDRGLTRDRERDLRLLATLQHAEEGGSRAALLREIWRAREALTGSNSAVIGAVRLQRRLLHKLRRAQRERVASFRRSS